MTRKNGQNAESVRINNRKMVLDVARKTRKFTVTQLAKEIHLSKTTLWKMIDLFQEKDLIINSGKAASTEEGGKKPELYRFNSSYGYVISISIYESVIILALTDTHAKIFYKEKVFIQGNENLEKVIDIIAGFIAEWQDPSNLQQERQDSKLLGIAIASSGVIDSEKGICFTASRFHSWPVEADIKGMLEKRVELKAPFYIDNFNRFFVFAEKIIGGYERIRNIVDIVTTKGGLGAGIIVDNKLKRGPRFLTGEVGHMCLDIDSEELCHCGGRGCFEQLVSSNVLREKAEKGRDNHPDSAVYKDDTGSIKLENLFSAADAGDAWARELMDEIIGWFAVGILNIVLVFNPEVVIITGAYQTPGDYFKEKLIQKIDSRSLIRMKKNVRIEYSSLNEEGSLLGAACYVIEDYFSNGFEY